MAIQKKVLERDSKLLVSFIAMIFIGLGNKSACI